MLAPNKQLATDSVDKKKKKTNAGTQDTVQNRKRDHRDTTIILFKNRTTHEEQHAMFLSLGQRPQYHIWFVS